MYILGPERLSISFPESALKEITGSGSSHRSYWTILRSLLSGLRLGCRGGSLVPPDPFPEF
jgi:hypothetical protein